MRLNLISYYYYYYYDNQYYYKNNHFVLYHGTIYNMMLDLHINPICLHQEGSQFIPHMLPR